MLLQIAKRQGPRGLSSLVEVDFDVRDVELLLNNLSRRLTKVSSHRLESIVVDRLEPFDLSFERVR